MKRSVMSLPDLIFDRAMHYPERIFLQDVEGVQETFLQTLHGIERWINTLKQLQVMPKDRVAVMIHPSIMSCHLWSAVSWLGAWEVPINPDFRGESLLHILNDTESKVLITSSSILTQVIAVKDSLKYLKHVVVHDLQGRQKCNKFSIHGADIIPCCDEVISEPAKLYTSDISTILYTSGTTGRSKGCVLPWGLWRWGLGLYEYMKDGSDCHYSPYPMNHLSGKMVLYNMAELCGRVVISECFRLKRFWFDIRTFSCTNALLMGSTATMMLKEPEKPEDRENPLRSVTIAPVPPVFREFEQRFDVKVTTGYGSTETAWPIISGPERLTEYQTCGKLRPEFEARIANGAQEDTKVGEVGELLIRCKVPDSMMLEYLNHPDETKEAWRDGWFHTGDAFKIDRDGQFYFVDRMKDTIRRRGENISSFEIEHFVKMHSAVSDCAAIGIPDENGDEEILIALTVRRGHALSPQQLIEHLRPMVPAFMIPRYVRVMSSLPITHTNKIKKVELRNEGISADTWEKKGSSWNRVGRFSSF